MSSHSTGLESVEATVISAVRRLDRQSTEALKVSYGLDTPWVAQSLEPELTLAAAKGLRQTVLRKLRHPKTIGPIVSGMNACSADIWDLLAEPYGAIPAHDTGMLADERLSPALRIAVDLQCGSLAKWLSHNAEKTPAGWHRTRHSFIEIKGAIASLVELAETWRLPRPAAWIADRMGMDWDLLGLAVVFSTEIVGGRHFAFYLGYVTESPFSSRPIRGIRLHRLLTEDWRDAAVSLERLMGRYKALYDDDDACEPSDALVILRGMPHFFLPMGHDEWAGVYAAREGEVPPGVKRATRGQITQPLEQLFRKTGKSTDTAVGMIKALLQRHGPMGLGELAEQLHKISDGRYDANNLKACLFYSGDLVRFSPDLYGLAGAADDLVGGPIGCDRLLNSKDCRDYVEARKCGEPMALFHLWTPGMEHQWCRWAEKSAAQGLYEELLFVVEPSCWPVSDAEKRNWEEKKHRCGRCLLDASRGYPLVDKSLPITHLLRALVAAQRDRSLSWTGLNLITGREIRSRVVSATLLAVLVVLGALVMPRHWKLRHTPGLKLEEWLHKLSDARFRDRRLSWSSPVGWEIVSHLRRVAGAPPVELAQRINLAKLAQLSDGWSRDVSDNTGSLVDQASEDSANGLTGDAPRQQPLGQQLSLDL